MQHTGRIVITGHSGLAKRRVVEHLRTHLIDALGMSESSVRVYHLEDYLNEDIIQFLDRGWWDRQSAQWVHAVEDVIADLNRSPADVVLLSLHLAFLWGNRFVSPVSWLIRREGVVQPATQVLLDELKPTCFVTLIDDVQAAQTRIAVGAAQRRIPVHLRLRELMSWRDMEVLLTDRLATDGILKHLGANAAADFPFEYSPVIAVRHSPEMLGRILSRKEFIRVYASFPISRTREKHREEIDRFRADLAKHVVVCDPLTIDEGPLLEAIMNYLDLAANKREDIEKLQWLLSKTRLEGQKIRIPETKFWPIPADHTLCREAREGVSVAADEVAEVVMHSAGKAAISRAIEHRDYRLIDQSDCVVVYRPLFGSKSDSWSGGTEAERQYAFRGRRIAKPVFLVHDTNDGGPYVANTFDDVCHVIEGTELDNEENWRKVLTELIEAIDSQKDSLIRRRVSTMASEPAPDLPPEAAD